MSYIRKNMKRIRVIPTKITNSEEADLVTADVAALTTGDRVGSGLLVGGGGRGIIHCPVSGSIILPI
jgi:hypothetical protein